MIGPLRATPEASRAAVQAAAVMVVALLVRLWIAPRYYGWEEGDYGNVMMVREVLDSGFTWFRPAHMPGWYSAAAIVRLLWADPRGSALLTTMAFSVIGVGVTSLVARRVAGPSAAWLVGLWMAVQPETALYGASSLRSPVFATLGMLGLWVLLTGRRGGFGWTALAFLTRMEGFFIYFGPALWTELRQRGRGLRSLALPIATLAGAVIGWQLYIALAHGERGPFWAGPMAMNSHDVQALGPWIRDGLTSAWALASWTLPRKLGWAPLLFAGLGAIGAARGQGAAGARAVLAYAAFATSFWLAEGFLARHEPNHNLYWVWMVPVVPPLLVLAGLGWVWLRDRLRGGPALGPLVVLVALITSPLPAFRSEAGYQVERSERWYRPQLELSHWLEVHARPQSGMIMGSIPEVWIARHPHSFTLTSWWFLPQSLRSADPTAFGEFVDREGIDYVMWFAEDWTEAPAIAPWLAAGARTPCGPVTLEPVDREDGYGWILYVVERAGAPSPARPPAFGQGAPGPGWSR